MSQFVTAYGSAVSETVNFIGDFLEYGQRRFACVLGEQSFANNLTDGGFAAVREVTAMLRKADCPDFKMGQRVKIADRTYRIVSIEDDGSAIDLRLQSPESK